MHVTILGKRYEVRFVPYLGKNTLGNCEDPNEPGRVIRIRKGLSEKQTLDTTIHEILHASDWTKSEEWIEAVATDLTKILWRLGYRKTNVDKDPTG